MTKWEFSQALRRGLGSAIIELQRATDKEAYRDVVLRCCLRDISYDWQYEGTKGYYLYSAISAMNDWDYFEKILIKKYLSRCEYGLFDQLNFILYYCAHAGSASAREALHTKYNDFAERNGRLKNRRGEGFQWHVVAKALFWLDGFSAFKRYANDLGELFYNNPGKKFFRYLDWPLNYDTLLSDAEEAFGKKRPRAYIDKMCKQFKTIQALVDSVETDDLSPGQRQETCEEEHVTVETLIQTAREDAKIETPFYDRKDLQKLRKLRRLFHRHASDVERSELAQAVLREKDETAKGILLWFLNWFLHRGENCPLDLAVLLKYAQSDNVTLLVSALDVLEDLKLRDKRLHDFALDRLKTVGINSRVLCLLVENYRKSDDEQIWAAMKKTRYLYYHVLIDIKNIYLHHRSTTALPILLRTYQKCDYSCCRCEIVKAMHHCGILPQNILEECLYDSYHETRKFAKRVLANKKRACDIKRIDR